MNKHILISGRSTSGQVARRSFPGTAVSGAVIGVLRAMTGRAAAAHTERPDVLFIAIEDVSPHRIGCYGNKVCQTPAIDKFATQGLRFTQAHSNPLCCPSRTALLLAIRPGTTGVVGNSTDWHKTVPNAQPMPRHFRQHGYETIRCGKMYHGRFEDEASWDRVLGPHDGVSSRRGQIQKRGPGVVNRGGTPYVYGPTSGEDITGKDGGVAEQGVRMLQNRQEGDKPLLLCLGFHATHLPHHAPQKYFDMYPPEQMEIPRNPGADDSGMPPAGVFKSGNPHTLEQWREAIAAHYACLSYIDSQVRRVLDALEESGRADQTIVVIWSDHGFMLGEHFLWRKGPLYNESTQVALLMRVPGVTKPESVCKRPVESVDIFPTLIDLCGLPQPKAIEAVSMKKLLANPTLPWKKGALMWGPGKDRSIVTQRYRYNEYVGNKKRESELFDHETDPNEFVNLAENLEMAEVRERLSRLIAEGWRACLPD